MSPYDHFIKIASGESLEIVNKKIGQPKNITKHAANFFSGRSEVHDYEYKDLGTIRFVKYENNLYVERVTPQLKAVLNADDLKTQLASDGVILQALAKQYYEREEFSIDQQDIIAATIWEKRDSQDTYTADAIAWLCKVIGKHNNPRYKKIMAEVANTSSSNKIRKYSSQIAESLPDTEVRQFIY